MLAGTRTREHKEGAPMNIYPVVAVVLGLVLIALALFPGDVPRFVVLLLVFGWAASVVWSLDGFQGPRKPPTCNP